MNPRVQNMLDIFQLKCIRKIFNILITYIDIQFSNYFVKLQINKHFKVARKKAMETLTEYHKRTQRHYLAEQIQAGDTEPGTSVTLDPDTLEEIDHGVKRVGRPRLNWYQVTLQDLWKELTQDHPNNSIRFASNLDTSKPAHVTARGILLRTNNPSRCCFGGILIFVMYLLISF